MRVSRVNAKHILSGIVGVHHKSTVPGIPSILELLNTLMTYYPQNALCKQCVRDNSIKHAST